MSDETPAESAPAEETPQPKKKVTRRKAAKSAAKPESSSSSTTAGPGIDSNDAPDEVPTPGTSVRVSERRISTRHVTEGSARTESRESEGEEGGSTGDSGEPTAVIAEPPASEAQAAGGKRRRRRRRKGGHGEDSADGEAQGGGQAVGRPRLDPSQVAKRAWKIYLSEVSEEGLALISDQDARELSRRSFRLAEIFLDEAGRRQGSAD